MFTHIALGSSDTARSKIFYDAVFTALGLGEGAPFGTARLIYSSQQGALMIGAPVNGEPMSVGNGSTVGLAAQNKEQVDAAHAAGVANGGVSCEDPPGPRNVGEMTFYLAYLRDPDGNKLCINHMLTG